jgi:pimeloyl-ACP methyl ester carboxylesterase
VGFTPSGALDLAADAFANRGSAGGLRTELVEQIARLLGSVLRMPSGASSSGMPPEIPDAFVRRFGEWSAEAGVKGKYSVVPYPACVGWLDRELPGWSLAEWIARQPFLARGIAALASQRGLVARMLRQNSPALPDDQVALYQRLWHSDRHVHAVFTMMAGWDVAPLRRSLGQLAVPTLLVSGANDPWFPPRLVEALAAELPRATHITLPSASHLSHEERPADVARAIRAFVATL